ncbi:hypothetical protein L7F22_056823 [Adiantum nelumboides]|nr:hypothetical protein [Adiantum nelumboides]
MSKNDGISGLVSDKLDKNNFHAWKFRMTNFLMVKGYWDYIDGNQEEMPDLPDVNPTAEQIKASKDWNQGARKVMYWLSVSVQDTMIGHIQDATSPKQAWDRLVSVDTTNTKARKIQLKNELNTIKKENLSINYYTLKIKGIVEYLASIGVQVEDDDKDDDKDGNVKYLADVLHVPNITKNLVSVGQMVEQGLQVRFNADGLYVEEYKKNGKLIAQGKKVGRMFTLDVNIPEVNAVMFAHGSCVVADIEIWHKRIGHANVQRLKTMQSQELVTGLPVFKVADMQKVCEACQFGKQAKASFPHDKHVSKNVLELVHSDVWGPTKIASMGGCRYTPQQNGVAEQKNRHIAEVARALMSEKNVPHCYWAEAVSTALYIMNRIPTAAVHNVTPEEKFSGKKPDLGHLKVFGCIAYVHVPDELRTKLDPKAEKCIFIGFSLWRLRSCELE